jgi:hypothetical protein
LREEGATPPRRRQAASMSLCCAMRPYGRDRAAKRHGNQTPSARGAVKPGERGPFALGEAPHGILTASTTTTSRRVRPLAGSRVRSGAAPRDHPHFVSSAGEAALHNRTASERSRMTDRRWLGRVLINRGRKRTRRMSAIRRIGDSNLTSPQVRKGPTSGVQTQHCDICTQRAHWISSDGIPPSEGTLTYVLTSPLVQSISYSDLNRRIVVVNPVKLNRFGWMERRLRHETRRRASVHLPSVHKERMTQVDCASFARSQSLWSVGSHLVQHQM